MRVPRQPEDPRSEPTSPLRRGAIEVLTTLREAGHEAYFAGGCVRDEALGVEPKDWDIATSARPEAVMALFPRCVPVGISFGVVRVLHAGFEYEVATFRADGDYDDHRRPSSVRWASAREDVLRRDFTINGLLGDPFAPANERIVDFVGGLADLKLGLIRAIGDAAARFGEDYLRMIRAVRFAARFGFVIHPDTMAAIVAMSSRVVDVSAERIGQELDRLLSEGGQPVGLTLLAKSGLLPHLLPELGDALPTGALGP
ncbi:MAG TPA: CCA tRNA nucleotidyltransferase, partial [Myxococcota bacterium]|nr:CCA tRNA nucleotidyltransferase [Myxococcota bacterium]